MVRLKGKSLFKGEKMRRVVRFFGKVWSKAKEVYQGAKAAGIERYCELKANPERGAVGGSTILTVLMAVVAIKKLL